MFNAEPHVNIRLKAIFKQVKRLNHGTYSLPITDAVCRDVEWFLSRYPLELQGEAKETLRRGASQFDQNQADLERILLPEYVPKERKLKLQLRQYQDQAVELILKGKQLLVGDETGLGKTAIAIGVAVSEPRSLPMIVACQAHLPSQWAEMVAQFSDLKTHIIKKMKPYSLPQADIYIISYSKLRGWIDIFGEEFFKSAVFDEIQELRRTESEKYRAANVLTRKCEFSIGTSATPIYNFGGESWNIFNLLKSGCLGSRDDFLREWCSGWDERGKVKDPKALGAFLRENYLMIRRTREEVGRQLPAVNKIVHNVEYNENYLKTKIKELKEVAARVLEGSFVEKGLAARRLNMQARMFTGLAKAHGVADYVSVLAENKEKVLLVGWHRECYRLWNETFSKRGYKTVMYTGSESTSKKNKSVEEFIDNDADIMIMSLRSGVGLDGLQKVSSLVVFGELDFSPGVHEQILGRIRRDGQEKQVTSIYLVTDGGTDPLMIDLLGLKASQAHGIMNPDGQIFQSVTDEGRIKLLAESILSQ